MRILNAGGAERHEERVGVEDGHWKLMFAVEAAEHNAAITTVARPAMPKARPTSVWRSPASVDTVSRKPGDLQGACGVQTAPDDGAPAVTD